MTVKIVVLICSALLLAACGGGGGGDPSVAIKTQTSTELAQICSKDNAFTGNATSATKVGLLADEKAWVKAYLDERYFWYRDMPTVDATAAAYNVSYVSGGINAAYSVYQYFLALLNPQKTASGRLVDQFSFMVPTYYWENLITGQDLDYGWKIAQQGTGTLRRVFVSYVYPTTASGLAGSNGVQRGDEVISIDGISANDAAKGSTFDASLNPLTTDVHSFVFARGGSTFNKVLTAASVALPQAESKVVDHLGVRWGYLLFNSHSQGVETYLTQAMANFKAQGVTQLVVDLRYNGGGYLSIANGLAYAVAGDQKAQGKVFETTRFNDKRTRENASLQYAKNTLFGGQTYTTLNLSKIYVLTSKDTCSASESFINSLRGIDVQVELIGGNTCGKPYGFYPQDNCGLTYAAMEFEGVNAKGQGGYSDGLAPTCVVSDDLTHALGNPAEAMFAQAIERQQGAACAIAPSGMALSATSAFKNSMVESGLTLIQPEWKKNKFLQHAN